MNSPARRASIRSFVLRQGRVSCAQERSHRDLMPVYGVTYRQAPLDLEQIFGRSAPKILEIGCGMGETTITIAAAQPQHDFLAVEVHTPGVGALLKSVAARGITNVRVVQHDAVEVIRDMIPLQGLAGIHIFFPDPWPKKRHHKRRLVQPAFAALVASRLQPAGYLHLATDWAHYAAQMLTVLTAEPLLANAYSEYAPRPEHRPVTKFESRGLRLGHGVWDLIFRRR